MLGKFFCKQGQISLWPDKNKIFFFNLPHQYNAMHILKRGHIYLVICFNILQRTKLLKRTKNKRNNTL